MSYYHDRILPWIHDKSLSGHDLDDIRRRVCTGLTGEVVEVGFGSGLNLGHYPSTVTHLHAVEPSILARRMSEKRVSTSPVPVSFDGDDGQRLPYADASMDKAVMTWSLCSIPDPAAAAGELFRVLVPGGTLAFVEHGFSPDPGVQRWQQRLNGINKRLSGCRLDTVPPQILADAGFTIENRSEYYLKRAPRWTGYMYEGTATKAG
jgi:ubiquinone/menaquinone biosynthesis C-methylase UbiE